MGRMIRLGRPVRRKRDGDGGFTLIELLTASTLSAILLAMVLIWLSSAQRASDQIGGDLDAETGLSLTLELALAELSDARPTALCLDPDPNSQSQPSPTTTSATPVVPPATTVPPCVSTGRGDNWGYWTKPSAGTRLFVHGSPFYEADSDKLCFYALPKGTVADPSSSQTPWGRCLEKSASDRLLSRTLEPETAAKGDDLVAAIASNYDWTTTGTWTERSLGSIDTISFEYQDFDGNEITRPVAVGSLDDIAVVKVTLTLDVTPPSGGAAVTAEVSGSLAIRANAYSPCRTDAATAPTCPWLPDPISLSLDVSTAAQIAASWTLPTTPPTGNVPETGYDVEYRACTNTSDLTCVTNPAWGNWATHTHTGTGTTATITGLTTGTKYQVRVRATNSADVSEWLSGAATVA